MSKSDRLQELHNKGQTDASNHEYDPPHDLLDDFLTTFTKPAADSEKLREENESYNEGHHNTWNQTHSGCFLTSACMEAAGKADDCEELTILRNFRDTFIRSSDGGEAVVQTYYRLAPQIVEKLSPDELKSIYVTVQRAVAQIGRGEFKDAYSTYAVTFAEHTNKNTNKSLETCETPRDVENAKTGVTYSRYDVLRIWRDAVKRLRGGEGVRLNYFRGLSPMFVLTSADRGETAG